MRVKLRDMADLQIGCQAPGTARTLSESGYPVLRMGDLNDRGNVGPVPLTRCRLGGKTDPYRVASGDVVFQARGARNLAFVLRDVPPETLASNHFYILRVKRVDVLPDYMAWFINQPPAQAHLASRTQGTTLMVVPREALETLDLDVPPLTVQQKIVELARLREREREIIRNLERNRDILIQEVCLAAAGNTMKK